MRMLPFLATALLAGWCLAGPLPTITDDEGIAKHKAAAMKAQDADCRIPWADIGDELKAASDALDAVDLSAFSGAQRATLQKLQAAVKSGLQANTKLVKRLKAEEAADKTAGVTK